jgi:hypothetical protein
MKRLAIVLLFLAAAVVAQADMSITFSWMPNPQADNVTQYILERSTVSATSTTGWQVRAKLCADPAGDALCQNPQPMDLVTASSDTLRLTDTVTGLSPAYYYRLFAKNAAGIGPPAPVVTVSAAKPSPPADFKARVIVEVR